MTTLEGTGDNWLLCYNKGCGKKYKSDENTSESCLHHPGAPFFHDAYKGWSCCNKKTTDFTDFLNMKGCTKSYHSNVKPVEPAKQIKETSNSSEGKETVVQKACQPQCQQPLERPSEESPVCRLPLTVGDSLKPLLEKLKEKGNEQLTGEKDNENIVISIGTQCKNGGCKVAYEGEQSDSQTCSYHPGVPIFHEGMKFWSCCTKRTTDFESFLEQEGCTTGNHVWIKKKSTQENKVSCRYDWHQTGSYVVVTVYSKVPNPDLSFVEANPVKLRMYIIFGEEREVFDMELILSGVIDVEKSSVIFLGSKVEIKMKKAEPMSWRNLTFPTKKPEKVEEIDDDNLSD
ncbi:cysteine and histidine-rich domain-containing protein 1-like [Limulus polyphemus]|uniref:Cysteine and histidine-rich domain-containing protein 1-like n=1 Tax=Limulus polyphemus TaxID=6850 RepID=A0ABM1B7R9_LIMPO|nr:cysteine and histidine-rich domain-containing protein 1-like [Limulus polyphemus]